MSRGTTWRGGGAALTACNSRRRCLTIWRTTRCGRRALAVRCLRVAALGRRLLAVGRTRRAARRILAMALGRILALLLCGILTLALLRRILVL